MARGSRERTTEDAQRSGQVQSITRALALLRRAGREPRRADADRASPRRRACRLDRAPAADHPAAGALRALRRPSALWQVGVQAFIVGNAFVRTRDVVTMARPYLRRLMEESGETVNLYLAQEGEAICMAQVECRQMMRAIARPGGRVKMHCSGAGKAMLAWLPERELGRVLERHGLPRFTERTLDTPRRCARRPRAGARARLRRRRRGARGRAALRRRADLRRARRSRSPACRSPGPSARVAEAPARPSSAR